MKQFAQVGDDDQVIRSMLGRLLFSGEDFKKSVKVLSGGEKGRMLFGKLMLARTNVLLMDEPTNHMDMESIESLNIALEKYAGTLIFVSHDREFVSSLATRILEVKDGQVIDYVHVTNAGGHTKYKAGDVVEVAAHAKAHLRIKGAVEAAESRGFADWIEVDVKEMKGKFKALPQRSELPSNINESLVVELYSK